MILCLILKIGDSFVATLLIQDRVGTCMQYMYMLFDQFLQKPSQSVDCINKAMLCPRVFRCAIKNIFRTFFLLKCIHPSILLLLHVHLALHTATMLILHQCGFQHSHTTFLLVMLNQVIWYMLWCFDFIYCEYYYLIGLSPDAWSLSS
jgi:hypothetical protein